MTPADRAACAAALKDATPEMLREDAALLLDIARDLEAYVRDSGPEPFPPAARRLAALALAVSRAMDFDSRVEQAYGRDYLILDIGLPDAHGLGYGGCDLPAALAALLKGDQ